MIRRAAKIIFAAFFIFSCPGFAAGQDAAPENATAAFDERGPAVTVFVKEWQAPSVVALTPAPLPSFASAPTPWRDARDTDADDTASLLYGGVPREFGVRVRLSDTDTAFVKVISFRAIGLRARALQATPFVPQTMLDRASAKAFAAGVRLRF